MMQLDSTVGRSMVWNFEFGSLGFVWNLVFDAWNFHYFHFAGNLGKISQLLG